IMAPVIASVDVVVVGASTGTVAAALAVKAAGASVFAVSDRTYFGEESAGRLELWRNNVPVGDPLLEAVFDGTHRPGGIKRGLEMALLRQKIPFLFLSRPVAVLRGGNGGICGLVLASRTALYAIRARNIVDA